MQKRSSTVLSTPLGSGRVALEEQKPLLGELREIPLRIPEFDASEGLDESRERTVAIRPRHIEVEQLPRLVNQGRDPPECHVVGRCHESVEPSIDLGAVRVDLRHRRTGKLAAPRSAVHT